MAKLNVVGFVGLVGMFLIGCSSDDDGTELVDVADDASLMPASNGFVDEWPLVVAAGGATVVYTTVTVVAGAPATETGVGVGGAVAVTSAPATVTTTAVVPAPVKEVTAPAKVVTPASCRADCDTALDECSAKSRLDLRRCTDTCGVAREVCDLNCIGVIDACLVVCQDNMPACGGSCYDGCLQDCNDRSCDYLKCDSKQTACVNTCNTAYTTKANPTCHNDHTACVAACPTN